MHIPLLQHLGFPWAPIQIWIHAGPAELAVTSEVYFIYSIIWLLLLTIIRLQHQILELQVSVNSPMVFVLHVEMATRVS